MTQHPVYDVGCHILMDIPIQVRMRMITSGVCPHDMKARDVETMSCLS